MSKAYAFKYMNTWLQLVFGVYWSLQDRKAGVSLRVPVNHRDSLGFHRQLIEKMEPISLLREACYEHRIGSRIIDQRTEMRGKGDTPSADRINGLG